ncbi:MAG: hypothetical protein O2910_00895 [Proteobacteria bacterium]|nr:hypothetical protein [Pseudomonadota bacterium]
MVFDSNTISDKATYPEPNHPAAGVNAVLVIGEFVIRKGRLIIVNGDPTKDIRLLMDAEKNIDLIMK